MPMRRLKLTAGAITHARYGHIFDRRPTGSAARRRLGAGYLGPLGVTDNGGKMSNVTFRELPLLVKAAVFVSFSTAWVMFEELVIDRYGLWRFLPFYKFGRFCAWDVSALVVIVSGLAWANLSPRSERVACALRRLLH